MLDKLFEWGASAVVGASLLWLAQYFFRPVQRTIERHRARRAFDDNSDAFEKARSAAILTVGLRKASQPLVLNRLNVARAAFLCSELACAVVDDILLDAVVPASLRAEGAFRRFTCDPDRVDDVRRAMEDAVDWLQSVGVDVANMVLDITGGTSVMSVGAYTVAVSRGIDTMYVYSQYDSKRLPIAGTQRGVYVSRMSTATHDATMRTDANA